MIKSDPEISGKPIRGSKAPGIGYLYIAVIMFLAITAGTLLSGGPIPVDPNGPSGPPTLPPYFADNGIDEQKILFPSTGADPKDRLQLKTFKVNVCESKVAVDFLIDTSESMQDDNKIDRLKDGLRAFIKILPPSGVIGIQTFSAAAQDRVNLDYYRNNKAQVTANIESLAPGGWTSMKSGFEHAKAQFSDAITNKKFPGYKYYLVILSDGVPETPEATKANNCLTPPGAVPDPLWDSSPGAGDGHRCFDVGQDPRFPAGRNLATDIKNLGVEIFSVGIFSQSAVSDRQMKPYLEDLLNSVSSPPLGSHYFGTDANAINLDDILKDLSSKICGENIGGGDEGTPAPTTPNYPFPTFPETGTTHAPYQPPGGGPF